MGNLARARQVIVANGAPGGEQIRARSRPTPGMGVIRHADAGYQRRLDAAERLGVRVPMAPR